MKNRNEKDKGIGRTQPTKAPSRMETLPSPEKRSVEPPNVRITLGGTSSERASPEKWKKIQRRAGELALNEGKSPGEAKERHLRRAKRELLGLQTLPDPDKTLSIGETGP